MHALSREDRHDLGLKGAEHVRNNYNFETFNKRWVNLMLKVYNEEGSWDTRKECNRVIFREVA